jgi:hypothetical protein
VRAGIFSTIKSARAWTCGTFSTTQSSGRLDGLNPLPTTAHDPPHHTPIHAQRMKKMNHWFDIASPKVSPCRQCNHKTIRKSSEGGIEDVITQESNFQQYIASALPFLSLNLQLDSHSPLKKKKLREN